LARLASSRVVDQSQEISSAMLLHKLGNDSRKNRLYQAFHELGRVVRTVFLLQYLSDPQLRQQITNRTNKVEAYNGFAKWLFFGGEGIIAENDPEEQEKRIKYNDLVANAVIFHNVIDQSRILTELIAEGFPVEVEDARTLSPYLTLHIKRFGDYILDLLPLPEAHSRTWWCITFRSRCNSMTVTGQLGGWITRYSGVLHDPWFAVVERARAVQHTAVVPHHDIAGLPRMAVRTWWLTRERHEAFK